MYKVFCGDCSELLSGIPENSIDLVVTSPPYDDIRFYSDGFVEEFGKSEEDFEDEKEYKRELAAFKKKKVKEKLEKNNGYSFPFESIVKQLYRCLKKGGVVVWVVGDATVKKGETGSSFRQALFFKEAGFTLHDTMIYQKNSSSFPARADSNRYSQIYEYMFVFSKDGAPKHASLICDKNNRWSGYVSYGQASMRAQDGVLVERKIKPVPDFSPRNNIWKYNTGKGYSSTDEEAFKHPAIFPEKLAEDCILTWSKEGDVVLDPFCGSGTTLKMALLNNRKSFGFDVSSEYCALAEKRLARARTEGREKERNKLEKEKRRIQKLLKKVDNPEEISYDVVLSLGIMLGTEVEYVPDMKKNKNLTKERQIIEKVKILLGKKIKLIDKHLEKVSKYNEKVQQISQGLDT